MERPEPDLDTFSAAATSGFSLVEVLVAVTLVTFGFLGLATLVISNERSQVVATEEAVVRNALRNQAERVRGTPFEDVLVTYQGFTFPVDAIGGVGTVTIFTDETESSAATGPLGFPRDLDGDGSANSTDISGSYMLLPVRIRISWTSGSGTNNADLHFLLSSEN